MILAKLKARYFMLYCVHIVLEYTIKLEESCERKCWVKLCTSYQIHYWLVTYHIPVAGKIGGNWIAKLKLVEFYLVVS